MKQNVLYLYSEWARPEPDEGGSEYWNDRKCFISAWSVDQKFINLLENYLQSPQN